MEMESTLEATKGWEKGQVGSWVQSDRASVLGNGNLLEIGVMVAQHCP